MASKTSNLERECALVAARAHSLRIRDLQVRIEGMTVVLEGAAASPEGADSLGKLFASTSAERIDNRVRHAPDDPDHPGSVRSPHGFVSIQDLGPGGSRLAEGCTWEVAPGDSLESIAATVYGDPAQAIRIVRANRQLTSPDDHLTAGTRLRLPQ